MASSFNDILFYHMLLLVSQSIIAAAMAVPTILKPRQQLLRPIYFAPK